MGPSSFPWKVSRKSGALSIKPQPISPIKQKSRNFPKRGQAVRKFPKIGSRKSGNYRISESQSHSIEKSGNSSVKIKWNEKFQEKGFRKFGYTSGGCPLLPKIIKIRNFGLNRKCPVTAFRLTLETLSTRTGGGDGDGTSA